MPEVVHGRWSICCWDLQIAFYWIKCHYCGRCRSNSRLIGTKTQMWTISSKCLQIVWKHHCTVILCWRHYWFLFPYIKLLQIGHSWWQCWHNIIIQRCRVVLGRQIWNIGYPWKIKKDGKPKIILKEDKKNCFQLNRFTQMFNKNET